MTVWIIWSYNRHQFCCHGIQFCLPFWSLGLHFGPVGPDCARNTKNLKQILILSSIVDHIWIPKATKVLLGSRVKKQKPKWFWELWATFLDTFWDQVWKVKTELSLQSEPSWEGWRVTDLWSFSHADPRLTPKLLWTRLLTICASLLELILEPYGVTLGSPFSKTFQTLS